MNWLRWQQKTLKYPASFCRQNNRISLFRAIQCTKYNLWTRTVNYGLAQLSVRAENTHNADCRGNFMQKSFLVYSKISCMQNAFQLSWNEIAICGLKITRKKHLVKSRPSCSFKTHHFIGSERRKMY